jgi:hypothetical protein
MPRPSRPPSPTRPQRARRLAALGAATLLLAGCQDARQRRAEHAVESYLRARGPAGYELKRTHCTRVARMVAEQLETRVFYCTVPTDRVTCDQFKATLANGRFQVIPGQRRIDCILPLH